MSRRDWASARRHLEAISSIQTPDTHRAVRYSLAHVAYAQGRYDEALDALHQVVESLSDGPTRAVFWAPAMEALTLTYARLDGGGRLARSYFRGLGGLGLVMRQSRLLGFALGALGRELEAIAVYEWQRSGAPAESGRRYARAMQAQNHMQLGNPAAAEPFFTRSKGCGDGLPPSAQRPCLYALGLARAAEGKGRDARVAWTRLESIPGTPDDVEARHWQGAARFALAESLAAPTETGRQPEEKTSHRARLEAYERVTKLGLARWTVPAQERMEQLHRSAPKADGASSAEAARRARAARKAADDAAAEVGLQPRWRLDGSATKRP